jgi:ribonuclease BN (tRNA processing enzyme)
MQVQFIGSGDAFGTGGRFHSCLHVTGDSLNILLDCGATAIIGLHQAKTDLAAIDAVLITHFHGDHFAGLPFLMLDWQFRTHRTKPLLIAGPPGIEKRWRALMDVCYPSFADAARPFTTSFLDIAPGETATVAGAKVTAFRMLHDSACGTCNGYRIEADGRVLAFTGDTRWTDEVVPLGKDADLLISECYTRARPLAVHLDYATLKARLPEIGAKRVVLTHMSADILDHPEDIQHEMAHDGLTIAI